MKNLTYAVTVQIDWRTHYFSDLRNNELTLVDADDAHKAHRFGNLEEVIELFTTENKFSVHYGEVASVINLPKPTEFSKGVLVAVETNGKPLLKRAGFIVEPFYENGLVKEYVYIRKEKNVNEALIMCLFDGKEYKNIPYENLRIL